MTKRRYGLWILGTVLIAAAMYAGAKWYAHYRLAGTLDRLAQRLEPRAGLSYGEIETDLLDRVAHIHRIELRPAEGPSPFRIDRVTLGGGGLLEMLFSDPLSDTDETQPLPADLYVGFDGVRLPTKALLAQAAGESSPETPCRLDAPLTPELLQAMGVVEPVLDGELSWRVDDLDQELETGMRMELRGVQSFDMEMVLSGFDREGLSGGNLSEPPQLARFDVGWHLDPEVGRRYLAVCAERLGLDPDAYRERLVAAFVDDLAERGFELGPELRGAVEQFYREWGELRLTARPVEPVGVLSLAFVPPPQLARQLGVQLAVNDRLYTDLDFRFTPPAAPGPGGGPAGPLSGGPLGALLGGVSPGSTPDPSGTPADDYPSFYPEPSRTEYRYHWRRVPLSGLSGHLDRTARVHLDDGRVREGELLRIDAAEIVVQQRLHGGKFTVPVPRGDVAYVEVRMREPIEPIEQGGGSAYSAAQ